MPAERVYFILGKPYLTERGRDGAVHRALMAGLTFEEDVYKYNETIKHYQQLPGQTSIEDFIHNP